MINENFCFRGLGNLQVNILTREGMDEEAENYLKLLKDAKQDLYQNVKIYKIGMYYKIISIYISQPEG